ncbi:MAG: ornithine cyclodeaminase [Frankiales bacterium]|nr:ornithine cyclodeaminase [Frankiales bacterium]
MQVVTDAVARSVLTEQLAIDAVRSALEEEWAGTAVVPARTTVENPASRDWFRSMPGVLGGAGYMGTKLMYSLSGQGVSYVIVLVPLEGGARGRTVLLDANWITLMRTAATAAVATDLLAPADVDKMAVIGTGSQARAVLDALCTVRDPRRIEVYSRTPGNREAFAEAARARWGDRVTAGASLEAALRGAQLVGSAIRAGDTPILFPGLFDGAGPVHVNALSSVRPDARELDATLWSAADMVVVDHLEDVLTSGDARAALQAKTITVEEIVPLSALRARSRGEARLTLYKSVGSALQDVSVAAAVYELAHAGGHVLTGPDLPQMRAFAP